MTKVLEFLESLSNTVNVGPDAAEATLLMIAEEAHELLGELKAKSTAKSYEEAIRDVTAKAFKDGIAIVEIVSTLMTAHDTAIFYGYGVNHLDPAIRDDLHPLVLEHTRRVARSTKVLLLSVSTLLISRGMPPAVKHEGMQDGLHGKN